jgi:hypothetical protein
VRILVSSSDPKLDLMTKMGPGRPKNQSARNGLKMDMYVGLVDMNPTQLERAQTNVICSRYRDLFILPKRQKIVDCTSRAVVQLMWQVTLALTWQVQLDQTECDMWHYYKGDTWHMMTWQGTMVGTMDVDVAGTMAYDWADKWMNRRLTRGMYSANSMVPRGPVLGYHVAPIHWLAEFGKICLGLRDSIP